MSSSQDIADVESFTKLEEDMEQFAAQLETKIMVSENELSQLVDSAYRQRMLRIHPGTVYEYSTVVLVLV
jgi:hypothetical protein